MRQNDNMVRQKKKNAEKTRLNIQANLTEETTAW